MLPPSTFSLIAATATIASSSARRRAGAVRQTGQISAAHGQLADAAGSHAAPIPPAALLHFRAHLPGVDVQLRQDRGEGRQLVLLVSVHIIDLLLLLLGRHFQKFGLAALLCAGFCANKMTNQVAPPPQ